MTVKKGSVLEETAVQIPAESAREDGRRRVIIEGISPEIDGGRFPAKRTIGDLVRVEADIFTDGHDSIAALLLSRHEKASKWIERPVKALVNDRWFGEF